MPITVVPGKDVESLGAFLMVDLLESLQNAFDEENGKNNHENLKDYIYYFFHDHGCSL